MKTKSLFGWFVLLTVLTSCQAAAPTALPTSAGQVETQVAATDFANQASTATADAAAERSVEQTLTAAVPLPTDTPESTPTPNRFYFSLPANACWMNSEVNVRAGQTVVIKASGTVNTWDGKEGSNGDPNGQKGLCGAIQCPLQGVGYGALIGRLGDQPPFFVGTTLRFTATQDGQLSFTANDWTCDDNSGTFDILITFL